MSDPIERAFDFAIERLNATGGNLDVLPVELQAVILVCSAQGVIDNGGFQYFFESDFPGKPPYTKFSSAYRLIGANELGNFIDNAVSFFPFEGPHLSCEMRNEFLDTLEENHELFVFGDQICGDSLVWVKLNQFIHNHAVFFGIGC